MWLQPSIQSIALSIFATVSVLLLLWQFTAGRRFLAKNETPTSLLGKPSRFPKLSILKPIGSVSPDNLRCIESWFTLDYPSKMEVLLGYDPKDDVTYNALNRLLQTHPQSPVRLVECRKVESGNPKVEKLISLSQQAEHDTWVVSDADVLAPSDLLCQIIPFLSDTTTPSMLCCPYRIIAPHSSAQKLESAANNIDFWSQATQALDLGPMDFAIGATMVFSRNSLQQTGGFESLRHLLADDFYLGHHMAIAGGLVRLIPVVVDCHHGNSTLREIAERQIRWARTIRNCRPISYFLSVLSNTTLWPLLYYLINPFSLTALLLLATALTLRVTLAHNLLKHFQGPHNLTHLSWWAPAKDLIQFLIWLLAFSGNTIKWNGEYYRLHSDGTLSELPPESARNKS